MDNVETPIKQTLAAYCHHVDNGETDAVAALFTEDAVLRPRYDGAYEVTGRSRIRDWYAWYQAHFCAGIRNLRHLIHSIRIEADGDEACAICYLSAWFISLEDGRAYQAQGTYRDRLRREGERWLFQERQIDVDFVVDCGTPLEQVTPMGWPDA